MASTPSSPVCSPPPAPAPASSGRAVIFSVSMTYHITHPPASTPTASTRKSAKPPKVKVTKEVKTKELQFTPAKGKYLDFLRAILGKYSITEFAVPLDQHAYPFKYHYKGGCTYV